MFFLTFKDGVSDFDLDSLVELLQVLDKQIDTLATEISLSQDPDSLGCFDRLESAIGLGFVACQQYIHATYPQLVGKDKWRAIQGPPKHFCGHSVAVLVNAAANYWKHHDEWPKRTDKADEEKTMAVINCLVPSPTDYTVSNVLSRLLQPQAPRFAFVASLLTEWRDNLVAAHPKDTD